ncbi:MAG: GFA family protein, partial [Deltaproteobacteria bacterium]
IVPRSKFHLVEGQDNLTTYTFGTGVAKHMFCKTCGIKSFYIPRSNPDGYDINVRCLDTQPREVVIEPFDGKNWELNAHALAHLSKET